MGRVLNKLEVKTIDPTLVNYKVNISDKILRDCITRSASDTVSDKTVAKVVSRIKQRLRKDSRFDPEMGTYTVPDSRVHCEVLLLRYHLMNPAIPPFCYFSVSKLCCYPCHALFQAYNGSVGPGEHKYFTKGCHDKIYPSWALPCFGDQKDSQIRSQLEREVLVPELTKFLENEEGVRALSDSTDTSSSSTAPVAGFSERKNAGMLLFTTFDNGHRYLFFCLAIAAYNAIRERNRESTSQNKANS